MGVMACSREGCQNILCNWYSYEYGYLCNECFRELMDTVVEIEDFMDSPKRETNNRAFALQEHRRIVKRKFTSNLNEEDEED